MKYCYNCGKEIKENYLYCPYCKAELSKEKKLDEINDKIVFLKRIRKQGPTAIIYIAFCLPVIFLVLPISLIIANSYDPIFFTIDIFLFIYTLVMFFLALFNLKLIKDNDSNTKENVYYLPREDKVLIVSRDGYEYKVDQKDIKKIRWDWENRFVYIWLHSRDSRIFVGVSTKEEVETLKTQILELRHREEKNKN